MTVLRLFGRLRLPCIHPNIRAAIISILELTFPLEQFPLRLPLPIRRRLTVVLHTPKILFIRTRCKVPGIQPQLPHLPQQQRLNVHNDDRFEAQTADGGSGVQPQCGTFVTIEPLFAAKYNPI